MPLEIWHTVPLQMLAHAEQHFREDTDFGRRIALISFDNSVEISITTYLNLNPIQRSGREYPNEKVKDWLDNYHTQLEFLENECDAREKDMEVDRAAFVMYHELRNGQYHEAPRSVPAYDDLKGIRLAAYWVFGFLFEIEKPQEKIDAHISDSGGMTAPARNTKFDIQFNELGPIEIGPYTYTASDVLYAVDPAAYAEELRGWEGVGGDQDQ